MTDRQEMLHEKLRADTPGESPAELRERAKMARVESKDALKAADAIREVYNYTVGLMNEQREYVQKSWWLDITDALDEAAKMARTYQLDCRDRANELDEQAEEASLSPSSRRLLHVEGQ